MVEQFAELGMKPIVGPELEFYVLEADETSPTGWKRYGEATGNVYVAGRKGDPENVLLRSLRHLDGYGLDVVAANHEFSSGQFEINLWHSEALDAADRAFRFKAAVKELARMEAKLATFMAKPYNDEGGSGFHLHFSTWDDDGTALFDGPDAKDGLSDVAHQAIAGILAHAPAAGRAGQPDRQLLQALRPGHVGPVADRLGTGQPQRDGADPARARSTPPASSCASATPAPTRTSSSPLCSARPTWAFATKLDPAGRARGLRLRPDQGGPAPAGSGHRLDRARGRHRAAELLGEEFVRTFVAYKRNELDPVLPPRHRLGIPRVRLSPMTF